MAQVRPDRLEGEGVCAVASWQQGAVLGLSIEDLNDQGEGVGRWEGRVVFVPNTAPGDQVQVRLIRVKPRYGWGQVMAVVQPSAQRVRPACWVADTCGGCQWQHLVYPAQLEAKTAQVAAALTRLGGFADPWPLAPIVPSPHPLGYRNKATYPLGVGAAGRVKAGYYERGSHRLINLNRCPVQDARLDPFLAQIKGDLQTRGWAVYNETTRQGQLRHLGVRVGRCTGEVLLTLVSTTFDLPGLAAQAEQWLATYPGLVGVCVNRQPAPTNVIFGPETRCLAGRPYLEEVLAGLRFRLGPETFFQVNTEQAEALIEVLAAGLHLDSAMTLVDAYCGVGALSLPLAGRVSTVWGLEAQAAAVLQAEENAARNGIANARFTAGRVEDLLPQMATLPDGVILDPPRKGCEPAVIEALHHLRPDQIAYVSCNPATLARDLQALCTEGLYQLTQVQPLDFFPQTHHVETVAFLQLTH
ncbi:MAG: 23S rRNA (uracil(1939)-C(5))-methyltransferase RlmD [Gloeomargaritaceae cyanobacterium C42_A2020_066]|nr:23S rRNA (uracil(1939)-C(5))-methyltransferase RlmD [Gloeomargaritaceae cyanobacterium C42_A2020_066]